MSAVRHRTSTTWESAGRRASRSRAVQAYSAVTPPPGPCPAQVVKGCPGGSLPHCRAVGIRLVQRLYVGRCMGLVCLRERLGPCESRPQISGFLSVNMGLAPLAWQWRLVVVVVGDDKHLSVGGRLHLGPPSDPANIVPAIGERAAPLALAQHSVASSSVDLDTWPGYHPLRSGRISLKRTVPTATSSAALDGRGGGGGGGGGPGHRHCRLFAEVLEDAYHLSIFSCCTGT
jgi:hypothetical protein